MSKKRICLACGKEYKYCPTCGADSKKPKWMLDFDTEACKDLFNAVSAVGMGADKIELQKVVNKYQIKDYGIYKESIKNALEGLAQAEQKRYEKANKKKSQDVELKNDSEMSE